MLRRGGASGLAQKSLALQSSACRGPGYAAFQRYPPRSFFVKPRRFRRRAIAYRRFHGRFLRCLSPVREGGPRRTRDHGDARIFRPAADPADGVRGGQRRSAGGVVEGGRTPRERPPAGRAAAAGRQPVSGGVAGGHRTHALAAAAARRREGRGEHAPPGPGGGEGRDRGEQRVDQPLHRGLDQRPGSAGSVRGDRGPHGADRARAAGRLRSPPHGAARRPDAGAGHAGRRLLRHAARVAVGLLPAARAVGHDRGGAGGGGEVPRPGAGAGRGQAPLVLRPLSR